MADPSPSRILRAAILMAAYVFSRLFCCFRIRHHRYIGPTLQTLLVNDLAADFGEQRMILAHGDIGAGEDFGPALSHQDIARKNDLAAVTLDAEPLPRRVAPVARRAARFLVCHPLAP